jgi:hypothetical protein
VDVRRIEEYLKRTKTSLSAFIAEENEESAGAGITAATRAISLDEPESSVQQPIGGEYEPDCPYRLWTTKFRLIEESPE